MKTTLRSIGLLLATFVAAGAFAATPTVEVTVRPASGGKAVHKATTDASGSFVLPTLPAGAYTLEFRTQRSPELVGKKFTLSIAGTRHMGSQGGIAGTSLVGGVAIDVEQSAGTLDLQPDRQTGVQRRERADGYHPEAAGQGRAHVIALGVFGDGARG